jgi:phosphoenolpyruvate carboxykinase (ATP)
LGTKVLGREIHLGRVIDNPSVDTLRSWAFEKGGMITQFGSLAVTTQVRSRIAKFTEIIMGDPQLKEAELLNRVLEMVKEKEFIQIDRVMCQAPEYKTPCRVYVSSDYPRLPLMWGQTLFPSEGEEPEFVTIALPEWDEKRTVVFPKEGVTLIVGSDYKGEVKKAMLRQLMYYWKDKGCLGVHAGSKVYRIHRDGELRDYGALFFGLSGTGKTSLSGHSHWLKFPERVIIRQDDVVILTPDGSAMGTEDSFYIKTDALEPKTQPLLYAAALSPRTILENVKVDEATGDVDFHDSTITSNGRAMVKRSDIAYTDDQIDLEKVHFIFFITRSYDIVPPVARLTPEWAAAAFMLGESVETSAGDPTRAGQPLRVVGTNPFIIGSRAQEGNLFLDILRKNPDIQCFVLNTGMVGGVVSGQKIKLPDTLQIIEMVVREKIKWCKDEFWGYEVPEEIPGLDLSRFDLTKLYSDEEIKGLSERLKKERLGWLEEFTFLKPEVINALNL